MSAGVSPGRGLRAHVLLTLAVSVLLAAGAGFFAVRSLPGDASAGDAVTVVAAAVAGGLVVLVAGLLLVLRGVTRRLDALAQTASAAARQVNPEPVAPGGPREVRRLATELNAMMASHVDYASRLALQALHDELTRLPNRALFMDRLTHALATTAQGGVVAVVAIDIDGFRRINASLGHAVGDTVLRAVGTRLTDIVRPSDTLARFGGDEFVVLLEGLPGPEQARAFSDAAAERLAEPVQAAGRTVQISACFGIAMATADVTSDELVRDAHSALNRAKEGGTNRVAAFDAAIRSTVTTRVQTEADLRVALQQRQLHLDYQPKVDLATGHMVGCEALLRWTHPTEGAISPARFVRVAEESGLIVPIGAYVLAEACAQAAEWNRGLMPLPVSVNLSAQQLRDDNIPMRVAAALAESRLPPYLLCLELTESMLLEDPEAIITVLDEIRGLGVRMSIDDFGTGYSSLAYLQRFPVDELKIDRAFVHALDGGESGRTLLAAIVAMAQALSLHVVAEGVETAVQAAELLQLGCHTAQGYFFARPQSGADLTKALRHRGIVLDSLKHA